MATLLLQRGDATQLIDNLIVYSGLPATEVGGMREKLDLDFRIRVYLEWQRPSFSFGAVRKDAHVQLDRMLDEIEANPTKPSYESERCMETGAARLCLRRGKRPRSPRANLGRTPPIYEDVSRTTDSESETA